MRTATGERILFRGHPCWQSMAGYYVRSLLLATVAGTIAGLVARASTGQVQTTWVTVALLGVFALRAAVGLLRRRAVTYTVTDRRLTIEYGLLGREVEETGLDAVCNVACRQTLRQRVLGTGTVHFDTAGGAGYDFCFSGIARPREIVRMVDGARRRSPAPRAFV